MSKITLGELWEKLDKNELGTERAKFKLEDNEYYLCSQYGSNGFIVEAYTTTYDFPENIEEFRRHLEVEWPIQEKKEKVLYPALVSFTDSFGRESKTVEYFESKDEVDGVFSLPEYDRLELLEWNPEGYPPITVKE